MRNFYSLANLKCLDAVWTLEVGLVEKFAVVEMDGMRFFFWAQFSRELARLYEYSYCPYYTQGAF